MFNFQGSDSFLNSPLLLSNSFIISHLFEFVKYFFKISFDFFRLVSFSLFWDATFILYHTLLHLSSTFSKFLLIFSWLPFVWYCMLSLYSVFALVLLLRFSGIPLGSLNLRFARAALSWVSFIIIRFSTAFVNPFLTDFLSLVISCIEYSLRIIRLLCLHNDVVSI